MSVSFYFFTDDEKAIEPLFLDQAFGGLYKSLENYNESGDHEFSWDTFYEWYTGFNIISYLAPQSHELYPSKDPSPGSLRTGFWYLRTDDEYDSEGNLIIVNPDVLKADAEIISKATNALSRFILKGESCSFSNCDDWAGNYMSSYWFNQVNEVIEWFQKAIDLKREGKIKKLYYRVGW